MKTKYFDGEVALVKCYCGEELIVSIFGSQCDCGKCYIVKGEVIEVEEHKILSK